MQQTGSNDNNRLCSVLDICCPFLSVSVMFQLFSVECREIVSLRGMNSVLRDCITLFVNVIGIGSFKSSVFLQSLLDCPLEEYNVITFICVF